MGEIRTLQMSLRDLVASTIEAVMNAPLSSLPHAFAKIFALFVVGFAVSSAHAFYIEYQFTGTVTFTERPEERWGSIEVGDTMIGIIQISDEWFDWRENHEDGVLGISLIMYYPSRGSGFGTDPYLTERAPISEVLHLPQFLPLDSIAGEIGNNDVLFYSHTQFAMSFRFGDDEFAVVSGTIDSVAQHVPDSSATFGLVAMAVGAMALWGRRERRAPSLLH